MDKTCTHRHTIVGNARRVTISSRRATALKNISSCNSLSRRTAFFRKRKYSVRSSPQTCQAVKLESKVIENLEETCDDFVCKSSPAVEQTIRQMARDIETTADGRRTLDRFAENVVYKDENRSYTGRDKYLRNNYISEHVDNQWTNITSLRMDTNEVAVIRWRLKGSNAGGKLDMEFTETFKLNVISGRVIEHTVAWDFGESDGGAKAVFRATRVAYSYRQALQDVADDMAPSEEEESSNQTITGDSMDPMKFFQQEDTTMQDAYTMGGILLFLWIIVKVLTFINDPASMGGGGGIF